jgi:hypothetical protein
MNRDYRALAALTLAALCAAPAGMVAQAQTQPSAAAALVTAQKLLPWAFPLAAPGQQREDDGTVKRLPGSTKGFSVPEINDPFAPPDWYPDEHPPMPEVVARGRKPDVRACGQCHMPRPQSSSRRVLPACVLHCAAGGGVQDRHAQQLRHHMRHGEAMTDTEVRRRRTTPAADEAVDAIVEPAPSKTYGSGQRAVCVEGRWEPIGQRIIELRWNAELRDSHSSFMAYAGGRHQGGGRLVATGGNKTVQCTLCHGPI